MTPELNQLRIEQLQTTLSRYADLVKRQAPTRGWLKLIREALGRTERQQAKRLGISGATLHKSEQSEADDRITLSFSSANHDPKVFGLDADQINFKREIKGPGFAFGPENEHICMGKEMVYRIMEPVIQTLRTAYPAPRLENNFKPSWGVFNQHAMFRAMATLKVHC